MDKMVSTFVSPQDRSPIIGEENGKPVELVADPKGKTLVRVFKTIVDPSSGR